jgi:hypothetical protein
MPGDFWEMTPREFQVCIDGYIKRQNRENDRVLTLNSILASWISVACFNGNSRAKKPKVIPASKFYNPRTDSRGAMTLDYNSAQEIKSRLKEHDKFWEEFDEDIKSGKREFKEYKGKAKVIH